MAAPEKVHAMPSTSAETLTLLSQSLACGADTLALSRWMTGLQWPGREALCEHATRLRQDGTANDHLRRLNGAGWQLITRQHDHWPPLLHAVEDAPTLLYVRGNSACLALPQLAMVGARHASPEGCRHAHQFARQLAKQGFVITSGLALGIDGAAHRGAIDGGQTLAVLAHGPDKLYPARHRALADDIVAAGGALITEFPPGIPPLRHLFPHRNRLIAGMSLATLVIEAAIRSGSLVTARLALELGREVFAMPGAIHNPFSRGCHHLLRDGAHWLESLDDLAEAFPELALVAATTPARRQDHPLLAHFHDGINTSDMLLERSGMDMVTLAQQLSELELKGLITRASGGYCRSE